MARNKTSEGIEKAHRLIIDTNPDVAVTLTRINGETALTEKQINALTRFTARYHAGADFRELEDNLEVGPLVARALVQFVITAVNMRQPYPHNPNDFDQDSSF